jgi:hypothetical protein
MRGVLSSSLASTLPAGVMVTFGAVERRAPSNDVATLLSVELDVCFTTCNHK